MRKYFLFLFISCLSVNFGFPQSKVDIVTSTLESVINISFDNWKMSPDLKFPIEGDPTVIDFNDLGWSTIKLNQYKYLDSCWLRKEIILPDKILGKPISGQIKLLVSVDDYGYIWINGEEKGYFPWDGEFILTEDAKPGMKFLLAIKAINTGGPLRLIRAQIVAKEIEELRNTIDDLVLSLRVGQKLLSFDTYQTSSNQKVDPKIDKSKINADEKIKLNGLLQKLAEQIDVEALKVGDMQSFYSSLEKVRAQIKPIDEFAKKFTLLFTSNAHIDAAWLWREGETIEVCKNTFESVLNMMDAKPDFTYTQSSAAYYQWMESLYPNIFQRIKSRVNNGRWELIGNMWIEPDCNLISGESWNRHLLLADQYFKSRFGKKIKIGWNPDSFGYNWNMPMFYKQAGLDAFITQKIGWNDTNVFPYRVFWWESPDGSRILTYFPFDYVNEITNPFRLVDWLRQFEANTGFQKMMVLFGVGDHGGGPTNEMLDRIERLKKLDIYPKIEYGTAEEYLNWLRNQGLSEIPVWKDELYLEYHQGTFTTQAKMKKYNRTNEMLLTNAEKFSSLATIFGKKYPSNNLTEAWQNLLFTQFHDILPGSSIREVYFDAEERHLKVKKIAEYELSKSAQNISALINIDKIKIGQPIVIFNPLSWVRTDLVKLSLPIGDEYDYSIFDNTGEEVPSQMIQKDKLTREIIFIAENVPSLGYKTYELRKQSPKKIDTALRIQGSKLENALFEILVDSETGWIKSIFDKKNKREILSGFGNEVQFLEDKPSAWDAWNIGLTGTKYPTKFRKLEVVENGPVRIVLRAYHDYLKPGTRKDFPAVDFPNSFIAQDIILYNGLDRIDFKTDVDWWEEKTMLKVAFPLSFSDTVATYEIPYGTIQRSTQLRDSWERAKVEVPSHRWADVSKNDYGVSLLNNSKYGYDIKGNVMRLSLLRSPKWPDPTADRGKHSIEYALYPHSNSWKEAKTIQRGYEFNNPLIVNVTDRHNGRLPIEKSFVEVIPANLILTSIKKAEDSDAWVIQLYESKGVETEAELNLPMTPKKVFESNFLEDDLNQIAFAGNKIKIKVKKNSVLTLKVYP